MKKLWFILLALVALISPQAAPCADPAAFSAIVSGSGSPMILIPGLACGGNVWDGTVEHFKSRYQCHVLTLAGFAGQPPIDGPFLAKVRDGIVRYIYDQKLNHPIIIGHSLGGMMAFWVAETAPSVVGPVIAVDGLPFYAGILNPVATTESIAPMAGTLRSSYADMSTDTYVAANHRFLSAMITAPENVDKVASLGDKSNPKAVGQAFYDLMTTDLRPNLKSIQAPVLLIGASAATLDEATQTKMREGYAAQIESVPHHKLVFAPTARHFIQLDDPTFFYAQVEEFLKANHK